MAVCRYNHADATESHHQVGIRFQPGEHPAGYLLYEEGGYTYATLNDFIIDYTNFAAAGALRAGGQGVLELRADRGAMLQRQL